MISSSLKVNTQVVNKCINNLRILSGLQIEVYYLDKSIHGGTVIAPDSTEYRDPETVLHSLEIASSANAIAKVYVRDDLSISVEIKLFDSALFVPVALIYVKELAEAEAIFDGYTYEGKLAENLEEIAALIKGSEKLIALAELLLTVSEHLIAEGVITKRADTTGRIVEYISANIQNDMNADILARDLFISKNVIYKAIKAEFGMTLGQYIQIARLDKASYLLLNSNKNIMEISEQCGIDDFNYFSRIFRKHFGLSPTAYRKKFA